MSILGDSTTIRNNKIKGNIVFLQVLNKERTSLLLILGESKMVSSSFLAYMRASAWFMPFGSKSLGIFA